MKKQSEKTGIKKKNAPADLTEFNLDLSNWNAGLEDWKADLGDWNAEATEKENNTINEEEAS